MNSVEKKKRQQRLSKDIYPCKADGTRKRLLNICVGTKQDMKEEDSLRRRGDSAHSNFLFYLNNMGLIPKLGMLLSSVLSICGLHTQSGHHLTVTLGFLG